MNKDTKSLHDSKMVQNRKRIFYTTILVSIVFVGKLTGAFMTNSLALFSDSWHLITDIFSLIISWLGLYIAGRPANKKYTFGYYRFGILTALINNISLILISLFIFYKAVLRYLNPVEVNPSGMIGFAILGLIVNSIIVLNLRENSNNLNVKSVFLHFMGDALADLGVLLGGIFIYFTHFSGIDTLFSALLGCLILRNSLKFTVECIKILLEATPNDINIEALRKNIEDIEGVQVATDIHVWSLSTEVLAMTVHVSISKNNVRECEQILHEIQHMVKDKFNIDHSTIQIEHNKCSSCFHSKPDHSEQCILCIDKCQEYDKTS